MEEKPKKAAAKRKPAKKKTGRNSYSQAEKVIALTVLQENNFTWYRTAKQLNIAVDTLKRWADIHGHLVFKENRMEEIADDIRARIDDKQQKLLNTYFETLDEVIERMRDLIPEERNLDNINKTFKILTDSLEAMKGKQGSADKGDDGAEAATNNYFQIIQNQLIADKGAKSINKTTTNGNTES